MKKFLIIFLFLIPCLVFSLSGGSGYFIFGHNVLDIENFNTALKNNGYKTLSNDFVSFGGGGHIVIDDLVIGGEGHSLVGKEENIGKGYKASISAGYGFFNIGYVVFGMENLHIYPLLGIGGGGISVKILEISSPSFDDILDNPKRGVELATGGMLISLSLCTKYLLDLGSYVNTKGGILLGLRLGYTWSPNYNWSLDNTNIPGAPDVGINGYFIRLSIGFGGFSY